MAHPLLTMFLLLFCIGTLTHLQAQPYRFWYDTTVPAPVVPKHLGQNPFPIGIFFYHYNHNYPVTDIWTYLDSIGADHGLTFVENFYDGVREQDRWERYETLIQSAPQGLGILPVPTWDVSILTQINQSREVTFYPFDSSQYSGVENTGMIFRVYGHGYRENRFTDYAYDLLEVSTTHGIIEPGQRKQTPLPRIEAIYDTGMANQTVASGVAFDLRDGQTERWDQTWDGSQWNPVSNPINSSAFFDGLSFDGKYSFRSPHYLVVTGHLFEGGTATTTDTLLRVNVYYEVGVGTPYVDSSSTLDTATINERFLYKSIGITKDDLHPLNGPPFNWDAHRLVEKEINFEQEGMGGPTADGATSRSIDIEVVYLGGEKVALHSVALRDTIAHSILREDAQGDAYRSAMRTQIDSLLLQTSGSTYPKTAPDGIQNLYISDEPPAFSSLALRRAKQVVEQSYVYANGDSLTTGNGWAIPHLQWTGGMDWTANGSYFTHYLGVLGNDYGFTDGSFQPFFTIPSEKHHNGGRFTVPEMFDITQLGNSSYAATMPSRIDTLNWMLQYARLGAAVPGQEGNQYFWLVQSLQESADWARRSGTRHYGYLGPINAIAIRIVDSTFVRTDTAVDGGDTTLVDVYEYERDTLLEHRPERSETRGLIRLALAYGAQGLSYYKFESEPWASIGPDGGIVKPFYEIGLSGLSINDYEENVIDWYQLDPNTGNGTKNYDSLGTFLHTISYDTLGVIEDLYVGWWDTYREIKESNAWVRRIAPALLKLRWRDAYSIHFGVDAPYTDHDDNATHRPLPADEIITRVEARHPVTGEVDSAWETYVELGLFETVPGYEEVEINDPLLDSNYIMVVNRLSFDRWNYDTNDISYPAAIGAILDTLTETRTITLDFHLGHPDSTQYAFIRVREVEPDLAELPLIGIREPLDTVIHGDSAVEITLGPGRAALLEITYEPPDESIVDGELWWSNQRKMIYYEDHRFHATYLRNDTVFYRQSMVMGESAGSILWEPVEKVVSTDDFTTRFENWGPSMTMRTHNENVIASIVWTCHSSDSAGIRDVVIRDLNLSEGKESDIHFIDYQTGTDSTQWGDAVISAAHGGDIIAWGDSTLGILARVRLLAPFGTPPALSARDSVSLPYHTTYTGRWPTVPTFTHLRGVDSSYGIAWNQVNVSGNTSEVRYARLVQLPATGGIPGILRLNDQVMSAAPSLYGRPTIDQTQDVWYRVQEGLAWIEINGGWGSGQEKIWFRSLFTPTNEAHDGYTDWDSIEFTQAWALGSTQGPRAGAPDCYPNISSLNEVYDPIDDSLKDAHFSIAYVSYEFSPSKLYQATVQYGPSTFKYSAPQVYAYRGDMPHGSSAPITQDYRHAILYEADIPSLGPALRTSRQYFGAKAKPTGYVAEGRSVHFPIDDSASTYIEVLMHDPWIADDASGSPLAMVGRNFTEPTDTLAQVEALLRTEYFAAGDSTRIGVELAGRFRGDSSIGGAARVSLIAELVDSASGTVVVQLDSIPVSAAADSQHVFHVEDYDLISGTYYIRVRLDTASLSIENRPHGSRYPVAEYASPVGESPATRAAVRLGPTTGNGARISAQPNPFSDRTEIRFSIHRDERVTIVIVDASGREVARPVRNERFEAGRYAVEFETGNLVEGTYVMELRAGSARAVEKLIIRR